MHIVRKIFSVLHRPLLTAFIAIFAVGGMALAQSAFTQPTSAPPNGNVSAPVNVGASFQQKAGNLWANTMGTDGGYCIGTSCITAWPTNSIQSCQMCISVRSDDDAGQCGGGSGSIPPGGGVRCAPVDQWTQSYRDDTDNRSGGCQMQWKLDCTAPYGDQPAPVPPYDGGGFRENPRFEDGGDTRNPDQFQNTEQVY